MLSIISIFSVSNITDNAAQFAVLYTLGNIVALCSTMFLWGPKRQFNNMTAEHRLLATSIYFVAMIVTFIVAFQTKEPGLVFLCILFQFLAATWYCLSYVPFARQAVQKCFGC